MFQEEKELIESFNVWFLFLSMLGFVLGFVFLLMLLTALKRERKTKRESEETEIINQEALAHLSKNEMEEAAAHEIFLQEIIKCICEICKIIDSEQLLDKTKRSAFEDVLISLYQALDMEAERINKYVVFNKAHSGSLENYIDAYLLWLCQHGLSNTSYQVKPAAENLEYVKSESLKVLLPPIFHSIRAWLRLNIKDKKHLEIRMEANGLFLEISPGSISKGRELTAENVLRMRQVEVISRALGAQYTATTEGDVCIFFPAETEVSN